VTNYQNIEGT
jgi:hypothetical protein